MYNPIENLRQFYQPDYIKTLFVGESAPTSGDFFYRGNSSFTTYTRQAFESAHNLKFISDKAFLDYFKGRGYFFDDLSHEPVDHLKSEHQNQALKNAVFPLAMRIQMYQPEIIIACHEKIVPHVQESIRISDIQCDYFTLPFPGNGQS